MQDIPLLIIQIHFLIIFQSSEHLTKYEFFSFVKVPINVLIIAIIFSITSIIFSTTFRIIDMKKIYDSYKVNLKRKAMEMNETKLFQNNTHNIPLI